MASSRRSVLQLLRPSEVLNRAPSASVSSGYTPHHTNKNTSFLLLSHLSEYRTGLNPLLR
jgi:hypothetical protein